eukprot:390661-Prymnesium_polylepis.1
MQVYVNAWSGKPGPRPWAKQSQRPERHCLDGRCKRYSRAGSNMVRIRQCTGSARRQVVAMLPHRTLLLPSWRVRKSLGTAR